MTVADLLSKRQRGMFTDDKVLKGELVALDAKDGKILFDTRRNKTEHIEKFLKGDVCSLWSDVVLVRGVGYGDYFKPIMKCYVSHDSWKDGDANIGE